MKFSYLNFENHPRGNIMLSSMLERGFKPSIVIEECSDSAKRGYIEQIDYLGSLAKEIIKYPSVRDVCKNNDIPYYSVNNLNNETTLKILSSHKHAATILGDVRILNKGIINATRGNIINVHPGYLPIAPGNNPYVWAVLHNLPQGVTCHFIDEGIDTGPIILRRKLNISSIYSLDKLMFDLNNLCAEVIIDVLNKLSNNSLVAEEQPKSYRVVFSKAPAEIVNYVRNNIKLGCLQQ